MAKVRFHRYTVVGKNVFPTDMLRYDAAWPTDHTNVKIAPFRYDSDEAFGTRSVNLMSVNRPTVERWNSFGWRVENIEEVR